MILQGTKVNIVQSCPSGEIQLTTRLFLNNCIEIEI